MWPFRKKKLKMYKITYCETHPIFYQEYGTLAKGYDPEDAWRRFVGTEKFCYSLKSIEEVSE